MNTQEYIASGILESYVLGLTSAEEAAEVELLASEHVEIRQAIDDFASSLENYAQQNKMEPPAGLKNNILSALDGEFAEETEPEKRKEYIPISTERTPLRVLTLWKFMAAASIILLVISAALNFYFYSNYKTTNTQYQALLNDRNTLQANNNLFETKNRGLQNSLDAVLDSNVVEVKMNGLPGKENNLATVYWNTKTQEVYFYKNNMDQTPTGKQYQLWAIVDGKPVDAGMIGTCDELLCHMKSIKGAQAFAITLEKEGGSPTPTMTAMYVLGKVS